MKTQAARLGTYMYYDIYVHFKNNNNMLFMDTHIVEVLKHDKKDTHSIWGSGRKGQR